MNRFTSSTLKQVKTEPCVKTVFDVLERRTGPKVDDGTYRRRCGNAVDDHDVSRFEIDRLVDLRMLAGDSLVPPSHDFSAPRLNRRHFP
jgi:hypothetical protein